MEGEWIRCVSLLARREVELVSAAWCIGCVRGFLFFDINNSFLSPRLQIVVI